MRVLITGSHGFIGKNMVVRLKENAGMEILEFIRGDTLDTLSKLVSEADAIVHLAGENRPQDILDFEQTNIELTKSLCAAILATGRQIPLIFTSSTQAELDNPYGRSKRAAEQAVQALAQETGNPVLIYRLPSVFGKWCKANYNSVVATFCYNIVNDLPIQINDPSKELCLVYVDDVVSNFLQSLTDISENVKWGRVKPEYKITLAGLSAQLYAFKNCRTNLVIERVGTGLTRALYATYVSYLPTSKFAYDLPMYGDERGVFVEMFKTPDSGQCSFFTAHPGITRGSHYHHSKTEKFLVIKGSARFNFRHVVTHETYELCTSGKKSEIVETIPGWVHEITNIGEEEMVVMLWTNEIFNREQPDTIASKV